MSNNFMQTFNLSGLHCEACVKVISIQLKKIADIVKSEVNLEKNTLTVGSARTISADEINMVISSFGYKII